MKRVLILILSAYALFSNGQSSKNWVDSTFNTLNLHEKIGQLFMIPVSTHINNDEIEVIEEFIKKYKPGSVYITKGGPKSHIKLINRIQRITEIPLLVGMNAEWGLAQTLDSTFSFPQPMVVGANTDTDKIKELGYQIGLQMKAIGVHINFGPNADIDVPFESTVTGRYLGSNKIRVGNQAVAFAEGLQQAGIIAVAKHLPGISPETDSENIKDLFVSVGPDTISFYPYRKLIERNIGGLLTSNFHFSTHENNKLIPAPISQIFISEIIKNQTQFNGLVFTDVSNLHNIIGKSRGEAEKIAFQVGNDILIAPENVSRGITRIEKLVRSDERLMSQLEESVKKILQAKFDAGLASENVAEPVNLTQKLFPAEARLIDHQLKEGAITLLRNSTQLIPIKTIDNRKFKLITIGNSFDNLSTTLNRYVPFESIHLESLSDTTSIKKNIADSFWVIAIASEVKYWSSWIKNISNQQSVVICHFGNPIELQYLQGAPVLLEGYHPQATEESMAMAIFGAIPCQGALPVTIAFFEEGTGITSTTLNRLAYSLPEEVNMDSRILVKIDSVANEALSIGAAPGARVMVARKGKVIFNKSYGWQSVDKKIPVTENTIYDLASVTKVTATLQAVMFLYERGLIDLNKKVSFYLPELLNTNKKNIIIKDVLTHQAGLWPYFPWHVDIMKDSVLIKKYFSKQSSEEYPFPVSENLFSHKSMRDSIWSWIVKSKMIEKKGRTPYEYRYSDLGLYIMQRMVQKLLNQPLEDFVEQNFYDPIGATTTGFLPLQRFSADQIAPTEDDHDFRMSLVKGFVHDPGSAMHGGVAGHAGLFSNANDLLKMGQMWLQQGTYGGTEFLKPETINRFTAKQFETSRRGLGWDKPTGDWNGSTGIYCSPSTFGHTGFTGTCVWVDPDFDLVFVFLSNRVNPTISSKLLDANIRTRIQDIVYQSIFEYSTSHSCIETKLP